MSYGGGEIPAWATGTKGWHVDKDEAREHFALALEAGSISSIRPTCIPIGRERRDHGRALEGDGVARRYRGRDQSAGVMGPGPNQRGLSRKHIIEACENSLRRLQMDYVDLYQIHRWDSADAD